jgi:hypothetical protein
MKAWLLGIFAALFLAGCGTTRQQSVGSGMGSNMEKSGTFYGGPSAPFDGIPGSGVP